MSRYVPLRSLCLAGILGGPVFLAEVGLAQNFGNAIQQPNAQPNQVQPGQPMPGNAMQPQATPNAGQPLAQPVPAGAAPNAMPQAPMGNSPFNLTPPEQEYLDKVLTYWQQSTEKIERFECKFSRWQFDPQKLNNPDEFYTASSGTLRYLKPDKGMFKVEEMKFRVDKPNGQFAYEVLPNQFGEWWICDGVSVHEYDRTEKKMTKHPLPANMRGAEVFNSPLPFVFGVDKDKLNQRYWVRPLPPPVNAGKPNDAIIVIEAYPKFQSDAINYHHVTVYLDRDKFLPVALEIALTQWTPQARHREVFEFKDRETNAGLLQKFSEALFQKSFIPEAPPKDWTVEEKPFIPEEPADGLRAANPNQLPPNGLQR